MQEQPELEIEETVTHEGEGRRWPLAISAVALGSLLVGMLVLMPLMGRPSYEVGLYDANRIGDHVSVRGERVATSTRAFLPDSRMVAVGRTDEGYLVYVDSHKSYGGGGGGAPESTSDLSVYDELWVRTGQNAYTRVELARPPRR